MACPLDSGADARLNIFPGLAELYDPRSAIVRRRNKGFREAGFSLVKLVSKRSPVEWTGIGIDSMGSQQLLGGWHEATLRHYWALHNQRF